MKRFGIYVFFEAQGNLRSFHKFYLKSLKQCLQELVVVVNGKLSSRAREELENLGISIFVRENLGFDFYAWRYALIEKGFDKISEFDELVLCNCSCYGPVYPFFKVFAKMDKINCDFWGLYEHPGIKGKISYHLQSYFLVFRKNVLKSTEFRNFWENLTPANSWEKAVEQEINLTSYFNNCGFKHSFYCDQRLSRLIPDPTARFCNELLKIGFPLVKRKVFTDGYCHQLETTNGSQPLETLRYLEENTNYPTDYIIEDLIATLPSSALRNILHLTYAIPDTECHIDLSEELNEKVALIAFSYYEDLIDFNISYINSLPNETSIFIVVVSDKLKTIWENKLKLLGKRNFFIRKQENRGRNENAYWLTCQDVIRSFDYICLIHDKKSSTADPKIIGYYFARHCMDCVLKNQFYVKGLINLFKNNPRIGLLMPPAPLFSILTDLIIGNEWGNNREIAYKIFEKLKLRIPFDESPLAPWGAIFWIRGKAMKAFYRYDWSLKDFPEEPLKQTNGTVLHALERLYPMIAQESGFLSAWVMPSSELSVQYDNLYYHLSEAKHPSEVIHFSDVKALAGKYLSRKLKRLWTLSKPSYPR